MEILNITCESPQLLSKRKSLTSLTQHPFCDASGRQLFCFSHRNPSPLSCAGRRAALCARSVFPPFIPSAGESQFPNRLKRPGRVPGPPADTRWRWTPRYSATLSRHPFLGKCFAGKSPPSREEVGVCVCGGMEG